MPYDVNSRGGVIFREGMDWSSEDGARAQARQLEEYWAKRGVKIETSLYVTGPKEAATWGVRSSIKLGRVKR
jgi:hypothetical protein